jgi:hypothetical protein
MRLVEIDPGPAMGIASGVKAISFRCCASVSAFIDTSFLSKFPESSEKPELTIIIPARTQCINMLSEKGRIVR